MPKPTKPLPKSKSAGGTGTALTVTINDPGATTSLAPQFIVKSVPAVTRNDAPASDSAVVTAPIVTDRNSPTKSESNKIVAAENTLL